MPLLKTLYMMTDLYKKDKRIKKQEKEKERKERKAKVNHELVSEFC